MPSGGGRNRDDYEETTRRLLDAAANVFVNQGYDKAVVSDIARRAGVTTGAVFGRWANKSDMMAAAAEHIFEQSLPEQRMAELGISDQPVIDALSAWAVNLLRGDEAQDVLVQAFASARNNDAIRERLSSFLDEQADQLARLVKRGRAETPIDDKYTTVAVALLIQAIGVGTHLLLSADRADRNTPTGQEWAALIEGILNALSAMNTQPPPHQ